jgi:hypothetical protein
MTDEITTKLSIRYSRGDECYLTREELFMNRIINTVLDLIDEGFENKLLNLAAIHPVAICSHIVTNLILNLFLNFANPPSHVERTLMLNELLGAINNLCIQSLDKITNIDIRKSKYN